MTTELEQAIAAREALHKKIKESGTPPHTDYWHQSLADVDERVLLAQESAQVDCYGMTPEERAELEKTWNATPTRDHTGRYVDSEISNEATGWAGCAKLNREEVEKLQIGNKALLARIKELEAENLRTWCEFNNAQAEAGAARVQRLADIGRIKELEAENERLRAAMKGDE